MSLSANLTPLFSVACHAFSHYTTSPDSFRCNSQLIALKTQSECQALEKILEKAGEIAEMKHKWRKDE